MGKKKAKNKRKTELRTIFFIILVAAVLFIISTYAWFSTQKNVSITNLEGTVEVAEGLEISIDAETWSNGISIGKGEGQVDLKEDAYAKKTSLFITIGGVIGVFIAAFLVKGMPMDILKWVVILVIAYTSYTMLKKGFSNKK